SNATVLRPEAAPEGKALIDALLVEREADRFSALEDGQVVERVLAETRRFLPAMTAEPLFAEVHRWPEAGCLVPGGAMKALHDVRQQMPRRVPGLFLAGEYMGIPSANGALQSGMNAAADCVERLSRQRS
ncbi:MAG: FAD-dependent oxidoreductase, partial [Alphaproteobacteria bacterium]|nr:FAD-dependent oxidoreductase [Alphaproteobacteria bacterium]